MSLVESMDLESRRCEQSIHDSRRLSHEFNEVMALLTTYREVTANDMEACHPSNRKTFAEQLARIDKCLAALKGHGT